MIDHSTPKPKHNILTEDQVKNLFNTIAGKYDFLNRTLSAYQDQRWRRELVKRIPFTKNGKILDVATGTGDVLIQIARKHPEFIQFYGIDISQEMMNLAKQKWRKETFDHDPSLQVMSAENLSFAPQSFDIISIAFGLRNVVRREKALEEFLRVLKPTGKLLILEFFPPTQTQLGRTVSLYFEKILPKVAKLFSNKKAYEYLPQSVADFYSLGEFVKLADSLGWTLTYRKGFLAGLCQLIELTPQTAKLAKSNTP